MPRYVQSGMDALSSVVETLLGYVWGFPAQLPWLVVVLLGAGLYVTARLAFIQLRQVRHAIRVVLGRYDDPDDPGDVNHFQALSTALSATVGIGNIAGVAIAIHFGGPGALFWMWVTAFFGMALKFAECTLGLHYRQIDERGDVAGGPMYYIEQGLGKAWKPLAVVFSLCAIIFTFGGGNMNQANTVAESAAADFGLNPHLVGIVVAVVIGAVILGGIRTIAKVASKIAPTMALIYIAAGLTILFVNAAEVPGAFATILHDAFAPRAGVGGAVAGIFSITLLRGVQRGLFSNEAGLGSAPIAHAAAKTKEAVREGAVAMLGPLIDTLIICTMTGLVIVVTGVWDVKKQAEVPLAHVSVSSDEAEDKAAVATQEQSKTWPVNEGKPAQVQLKANHGPIADPVIYVGKQPLRGSIRYQKGGALAAFLADGSEVDAVVRGRLLQNGAALTAWGFETGLAPIFPRGNYVVTICVFLFAISTMISWSYYGDRCVAYLFGIRYVIVYRAVYVGFVYIGATTRLETVWNFSDVALGLMAVPNLIAVTLLMPTVVRLTQDYFTRFSSKTS